MRITSGLLSLALIGFSCGAVADEPIKLSDASLDDVTGGLYITFARSSSSLFGGTGATVNAISVQEFRTFEIIELSPSTFNVDVGAFAASQTLVQARNVGASSAQSGGRVETIVTPSLIN